MTDNTIDRAAFKRLGSGKEGCTVPGCTDRPIVSIGLTATEVAAGTRAQGLLARRTHKFCARHGEAKFAQLVKAITN